MKDAPSASFIQTALIPAARKTNVSSLGKERYWPHPRLPFQKEKWPDGTEGGAIKDSKYGDLPKVDTSLSKNKRATPMGVTFPVSWNLRDLFEYSINA